MMRGHYASPVATGVHLVATAVAQRQFVLQQILGLSCIIDSVQDVYISLRSC